MARKLLPVRAGRSSVDEDIEQLPHQHLLLAHQLVLRVDGVDQLHDAGIDALDVSAIRSS
jgi:hypothetical protein